mgnify:CR=1 FL=1
MKQNKAKGYMETIYGKKKVMTLCELVDRMMVSEITVRRKLKKSGALITVEAAIFTEGDPAQWEHIISLGHLPVFTD